MTKRRVPRAETSASDVEARGIPYATENELDKPKYAYQSAQDSILRPYYQRWVWAPLLRFVPASISPNTLTALSTLSAATSFLLAAFGRSSSLAMVGASLCVFAYLSLDNLSLIHI